VGSEAIWTYIHKFSSHLAKEQSARLHHYSQAHKALAILRSQELWASSLLFMKNNSEAKNALTLSLKMVERLLERSRMPQPLTQTMQLSYSVHPKKRYALYQHLLLSKLKSKLAAYLSAEQHVLIASFSETSDTKSSWLRYGSQSGYALGFSANQLSFLAADQSFSLWPCYYADKQEQGVIVQGALIGGLQAWLGQIQDIYHEPDDLHAAYLESLNIIETEADRVHLILLQVACLLKNESEQHEQEWRLVSDSVPAEYLHYDEQEESFFPYAPFDYADALREVRLNVSNASETALALKGFLASKQNAQRISLALSQHRGIFKAQTVIDNQSLKLEL